MNRSLSEREELLLLESSERELTESELFELVGDLDPAAHARINRSRENILRAMKTSTVN
jgi:hypothetical protein